MADAKRQAQALEVDIKRTPVQLANTPTFKELADEWRKLKKDKQELKTQLRYEGFLEQFAYPATRFLFLSGLAPYSLMDDDLIF